MLSSVRTFVVLAPFMPAPPPVRFVREAAVVAAPPFSGFETHVSADGTTAMTAGYGGDLTFWRIGNDGRAAFLDALRLDRSGPNGDAGLAFALSPNGRRFAVSTWDGRLEVWDRATTSRVYGEGLSRSAYGEVAFHPTRPWLLVGGQTGARRIDLGTGKKVPLAGGWPLEAVPGSDLLASPLGLTDGATGRLVRRWAARPYNVEPLRVSPDGKLVVIGGEDPGWSPPTEAATESAYARSQTLRTWRVKDGRLLRTMEGFWTMDSGPRDLVWLDARRLAIPGKGEVRDAVTGRVVRKMPPEKEVYERPLGQIPVTIRKPRGDLWIRLRFPDAGARVSRLGFGPGAMVAVHDVRTAFRNPGVTVGGRQAVTTVTARGRTTTTNRAISGGAMGFDAEGAFARETWAVDGPAGIALFELVHRPFGQPALAARRTLFPKAGPSRTETFPLAKRQGVVKLIPEGYRSPMSSISAVVGDGVAVLNPIYNETDSLIVFSTEDGRELWRAKKASLRVQSSSIAIGGGLVALTVEKPSSRDQELLLLRAATGEVVHRIPTSMVYTMAFSPDAHKLAVVSDESVAVVDLDEAKPTVRPMRGGPNVLDGNLSDPVLYWTPGGRLVVGGSLRPITIYDPTSGDELATARFFGDGTWAAVRRDGATDGPAKIDVRLWQNARWVAGSRREAFFLRLLE